MWYTQDPDMIKLWCTQDPDIIKLWCHKILTKISKQNSCVVKEDLGKVMYIFMYVFMLYIMHDS